MCNSPLKSYRDFKSSTIDEIKSAGGSIIKTLHNKGFGELGNLLEIHRGKWIQELVEMRDTVAHITRLHGFHCFIEKPFCGGDQVPIHYPSMPSGVRVDTYCQSVYENLLNLYRSALDFIKK